MQPFISLLAPQRDTSSPLYLQIANSLVSAIRSGHLLPGSKLPGTRELAKQLKVHRKTVIAAYNELYAQSWTEVLPQKGTRVARNLPEIKAKTWSKEPDSSFEGTITVPFYKMPPPSPFTPMHPVITPHLILDEGIADNRLAPLDLLFREYRSRLKHSYTNRTVQGALAAGSPLLRESLVPYFGETRGLSIQPSNILITQGAQMSIYLAASLLIRPGDYVLVAEPNYFLANKVFEQLGAKLLKIPADDQGIDLQAAEICCKKHRISMMYVIPHHHHPTTVTLSPERRMQLLELSAKYNFAILEDDYDYDFHYSSTPYLPLAGSKHNGRIIYLGSFSKLLSTSVRAGFMIAHKDFIDQVLRLRVLIDLRSDHLLGDSLAALINNGDLARYVKKANKVYHQRRDKLCELMDQQLKGAVSYKKPDGGMAVWVKFNPEYPLKDISIRASAKGLYLSNGEIYNTEQTSYNAVRIGFASLNTKEMEEAVLILKQAIFG
eukprot:gene3094-3544_t